MEFSRKNKTIYIDTEALSTLALVQEGLLSPVKGLMNEEIANRVNEDKNFQGVPFPFSFILAPIGEKNQNIIKSLKPKEVVTLISNNKEVGEIEVEDIFEINPQERLSQIYGTSDTSHPGVKNTTLRLGNMAVSGKYSVSYPIIRKNKEYVAKMIKKTKAKKVSAMMLASNPLNRAHERMIRQTLSSCDLLVIFLRKPFTKNGLDYDIRAKALNRFIDNYLPSNKVIVVPFENTYIFAEYNELILDAMLAQNYGCDKLVVGKNHAGLGLYFDDNRLNTIFDKFKNIEIEIIDEFVYCDICNSLVSLQTCPHGQHHHVHYHSNSIMKLIQSGIIPPTILVRKEVSASIISALYPNRFDNLQNLYYSLMPGNGLIEEKSEEEFYIKLMELYRTTSLS
ncbi:Sulfate adenylyltransferase, dissimilatory-type [hydrothermal vent metagenome]|uniref:Sulfate adenylyltransferase, dissimilatory-type n=1 Tax=hydrothermal vent metagenome TaxID=652676 RepID=A0A1W1EJ67_9ZZZZ